MYLHVDLMDMRQLTCENGQANEAYIVMVV
jgi:hypothetical protein